MIDFPLNLRDKHERWTWRDGSFWLGLDQFERFRLDVGLVLDNVEAVKLAVRSVLRVEYTITAANRARWAADPNSPDELDESVPVEELAKSCFRTMSEMARIHDTARVAAWLTGPVLASNTKPLWPYLWKMLLYRLGEVKPGTLASHGIPIDTAQKLIKIAFRHRSEVDAIEERIEVTQEEPLSEWDAIAYADYIWDSLGIYPLRGLDTVYEYVSFDRKWPEVMGCLPPAYIEALIRWGRANLGPKDPSSEHLTIPDDIRAAWHQAWRN